MHPVKPEYLFSRTKIALLIVDVQNDFCHSGGAIGSKGVDMRVIDNMMDRLEHLLSAARKKHLDTIFIQNIEDETTDSFAWKMRPDAREDSANEGICRRGTWGTERYRLNPLPGEIVMPKHRFSGFLNTPLDDILKNRGVETVIITGVATNVCVETTARHAIMLDYHVIIAEDACATFYPDLHEATIKNVRLWFGNVMTTEEIIERLGFV